MTEPAQLELGRINSLQAIKDSAYGLFLDGYAHGEILLPRRFVPEHAQPGDWLQVFVYADSEDRLIATTQTPLAMVGEVASLRVAAVNNIGAFLDWGLGKDVLVPFSEQAEKMQEGFSYCVYLYVDRRKDRIVASSRLSKFLPEQSIDHRAGQSVKLLVCSKSELGFKCLVDEEFLALLHHGDVFQPITPGRSLQGYIKRVRTDGRIDLCLSPPGKNTQDELEQKILLYLQDRDGVAAIGDKSPPDEIYKLFQTSKKNFKRALAKLYKNHKISIGDGTIKLVDS